MIHIDLENFKTDVIDASNTTPILINLGSANNLMTQSLTDTLTQLEQSFKGAFTLALVNCDTHPQIAQAFGVRQLPTTILLIKGEVADGFSHSLSEAEIRELLLRHIQPLDNNTQLNTQEDALLNNAENCIQNNDLLSAITHCKAAIAINQQSIAAHVMLTQLLLKSQPNLAYTQYQLLDNLLKNRPESEKDAVYWKQMDTLSQLKLEIDTALNDLNRILNSPELHSLKEKIANNPNDLNARLLLAKQYQDNQVFDLAVEQLLKIVYIDRSFGEEIARKTLINIFNQAIEMPDQVRQWRKQLSAILN